MIGRWPLHPILLSIFPILSLYQANHQFVRPQELTAPLLISTAVAGGLWVVVAALTRDVRRSAQTASVLVCLLFGVSFGPALASFALTELSVYWVRADVLVSAAVVIAVLLPLSVFLIVRIWRKRRDPRGADGALNLMGAVLVVLPAWQIGSALMAGQVVLPYKPEPLFRSGEATESSRPSIFYLVLDGYARDDVLRDLFGVDNEPFLRELESRGFQVARECTSNYVQTPLSLASSLNARYLREDDGDPEGDREQLRDRIGQNAVTASLKGLGYRTVAFDSGFDLTNIRLDVDEFRSPRPRPTGFHQYLIEHSPLHWLESRREGGSMFDQARERIEYAMEGLPRLAASGNSIFAFVHIIIPHPPFLYKADGSPYEKPGDRFNLVDGDTFKRSYGGEALYREGYRGQVEYLNRRLLEVIDRMLEASPEPPVILIQSDHGSGLNYWLDDVEATDLRERFGNFTAVLLPAGGAPLRQDITPVNLFRVVLRQVFGVPLEELDDRCYFSTFSEPYKYIDVTDRVRARSRRVEPGIARETPEEEAPVRPASASP